MFNIRWCLLIGLSVFTCSCGSKHTSHNKVALEFLEYVHKEQYEKATEMIYDKNVAFGGSADDKLTKLYHLLMRYDIPDSSTWVIEYDTMYIVRRKSITIPLLRENKANDTKEASVTIDLEHGGAHIGNKLMGFRVDMHNVL